MSAELLGGRLLGEVQEESLDEVRKLQLELLALISAPLFSIRSALRRLDLVRSLTFLKLLREIKEIKNLKPSSRLGILPLDTLLDVFRHPLQQATLQRPSWAIAGGVPDDDRELQDHPANLQITFDGQSIPLVESRSAVIELSSSHSASGKTNLLYRLAANAVVPKAYGGTQSTVAWLDTDGRFSALRLSQIVENSLRTHQPKTTDRECDLLVREASSHIHVFRPQSSAQLILTLESLQKYLLSPTQHTSQSRQLSLLILDSATAFHWPDRSDAELQRLNDPGTSSQKSKASTIISSLKFLQQKFDCTVIFTTDQSFHSKPKPHEPAFVSPWTSFATLSMHLSRTAVPQFAPTMSLEECVRDQPKRLEAVRRWRFRASVLWTGAEGSVVRDAVAKLEGGDTFNFRITENGIEIE